MEKAAKRSKATLGASVDRKGRTGTRNSDRTA